MRFFQKVGSYFNQKKAVAEYSATVNFQPNSSLKLLWPFPKVESSKNYLDLN